LTISSGATDWGTNPDNTTKYVVSGLAKIQDNNALANAFDVTSKNNLTFAGLSMEDFEAYAINTNGCDQTNVQFCLVVTATGRGLYFGKNGSFVTSYNWLEVSVRGVVPYYGSTGSVTSSVIKRNGAAGTGDGIYAGYGCVCLTTSNLLEDWAVGITALVGGFVANGTVQTFTNCTSDTATTGTQATDPAYIS